MDFSRAGGGVGVGLCANNGDAAAASSQTKIECFIKRRSRNDPRANFLEDENARALDLGGWLKTAKSNVRFKTKMSLRPEVRGCKKYPIFVCYEDYNPL